jgi:hypothetical protein
MLRKPIVLNQDDPGYRMVRLVSYPEAIYGLKRCYPGFWPTARAMLRVLARRFYNFLCSSKVIKRYLR